VVTVEAMKTKAVVIELGRDRKARLPIWTKLDEVIMVAKSTQRKLNPIETPHLKVQITLVVLVIHLLMVRYLYSFPDRTY
jgi:hypothetical protein